MSIPYKLHIVYNTIVFLILQRIHEIHSVWLTKSKYRSRAIRADYVSAGYDPVKLAASEFTGWSVVLVKI